MARSNRSANSFSVGTGFLSCIPTSPLASCVLRAASICSAVRLLVCFVLARISCPFHENLYHHCLLFFLFVYRHRFCLSIVPTNAPWTIIRLNVAGTEDWMFCSEGSCKMMRPLRSGAT